MAAFEELRAKGHKVPQLDSKPELPAGIEIVQVAYNDLVYDGKARFTDFVVWADRFLVDEEQFEYVWDALGSALEVIAKWKQKQQPSSSNSSVKMIGNSGQAPAK